jgi:predicted  nucleic acid-binding Zn-ribbon protein
MAKKKELTGVAEKLEQLADLQTIHTKMDQIKILRGELPIEVADLEDEISGLEKRMVKIGAEIKEAEDTLTQRKQSIKDANNLITKYDKQLLNVKNNREYDALTKEIELQKLEIQLAERKIRDADFSLESLKKNLEETKARHSLKAANLASKKKELNHITKETEKEEQELRVQADALAEHIDERLLAAYNRIRKSYKNGLAVVNVVRNACGGCFGFIPAQTQAEIRTKKRIIPCEHCGRILFDVNDDVVISDEEMAL